MANSRPYSRGHDMVKCCKYKKDCSPKDKLAKPFDPSKKTWKIPGGRSNQMAYLTEKVNRLEERLKKARTKKLTRKSQKGTTKIWDLTVDGLTGLPWTGIYKKKNQFIKIIKSVCQCI
jgi:hypothetical protein